MKQARVLIGILLITLLFGITANAETRRKTAKDVTVRDNSFSTLTWAKHRSYDFIMDAGGLKLRYPKPIGNSYFLPVHTNVTGASNITHVATSFDDGLAVNSVELVRDINNPYRLLIYITTVKKKGKSPLSRGVRLGVLRPGDYRVDYLNPDGTSEPLMAFEVPEYDYAPLAAEAEYEARIREQAKKEGQKFYEPFVSFIRKTGNRLKDIVPEKDDEKLVETEEEEVKTEEVEEEKAEIETEEAVEEEETSNENPFKLIARLAGKVADDIRELFTGESTDTTEETESAEISQSEQTDAERELELQPKVRTPKKSTFDKGGPSGY